VDLKSVIHGQIQRDVHRLHEDITAIRIAAEIGLDSRQVDEILAGDHYAEDVRADERFAQELGITLVPAGQAQASTVVPPATLPHDGSPVSVGGGAELD